MKYLLIGVIVVLAVASFYADFRWKKWIHQQQARRHEEDAPHPPPE